jgi:hypothetical protein
MIKTLLNAFKCSGNKQQIDILNALADELEAQGEIHNRRIIQIAKTKEAKSAVLVSTAVCRALEQAIRRVIEKS